MTLSRDDVRAVLGDVDDVVVTEIISTGATREELAEAHAWVGSDDAMVNALRPLPSGVVGRVIEILEELESEPAPGEPAVGES